MSMDMERPILKKCDVFYDRRGLFAPLAIDYKGYGDLDKDWVQSNLSISDKKFTLRGLHFQTGEFAQAKIIKVINGEILDFVVDIRPESPEYMNLFFFELDNSVELYVPKGYAHGFISLTDNVILQYLVDNHYSRQHEGCLCWTEDINIYEKIKSLVPEFKSSDVIISDKDKISYNLPEVEVEVEDRLKGLINLYPNDMDLGRKVRELYHSN